MGRLERELFPIFLWLFLELLGAMAGFLDKKELVEKVGLNSDHMTSVAPKLPAVATGGFEPDSAD